MIKNKLCTKLGLFFCQQTMKRKGDVNMCIYAIFNITFTVSTSLIIYFLSLVKKFKKEQNKISETLKDPPRRCIYVLLIFHTDICYKQHDLSPHTTQAHIFCQLLGIYKHVRKY